MCQWWRSVDGKLARSAAAAAATRLRRSLTSEMRAIIDRRQPVGLHSSLARRAAPPASRNTPCYLLPTAPTR